MLLPNACVGCRARGPVLCSACLRAFPAAPAGAPVPAAFAYAEGARQAVLALKGDGRRALAPVLAAALVPLVATAPGRAVGVTWAPTSPERRRARGFDQAEVLARSLAARLGVRAVPTLGHRPGPSQTGRSRAQRLVTAPSFVALRPLQGGGWVVVDDVVTTGATLAAARTTLLAAGAAWVHAVAVAATR